MLRPSLKKSRATSSRAASAYRRTSWKVVRSSRNVPRMSTRAGPRTTSRGARKKKGRANARNHAATSRLVARMLNPAARVIPNHGTAGCTNPTKATTSAPRPPR